MTAIEEEAISYIATSGDLTAFTSANVTPVHFLDPLNRAVFTDILAFKADYGEAPTPEVILRDHPGYPLAEDFSGPPEYLIAQLHAARLRTVLDLGVDAANDALDADDTTAALAALRITLSQAAMTTPSGRDIDYATTGAQRLERYRAARDNPGRLLGFPTGFVCLDTATLGIQRQQMIVLTGLAKSCKTTVMLRMLRSVYEHGATALVVSFEMPEIELSRRLDGFLAEINPRHLQTGEFSELDWKRLEKALLTSGSAHPLVITEDRGSVMTLTGLQAKIDTLKPDALFVDGAYFLLDETSGETDTPRALTNISRGLKRLALTNNLPVIVSTQSLAHKVGARGLTLNSLGYTSAWGQDADVVIGAEAVEEQFHYLLKILASRNCSPQEHTIAIRWDPPGFEEMQHEEFADLPY